MLVAAGPNTRLQQSDASSVEVNQTGSDPQTSFLVLIDRFSSGEPGTRTQQDARGLVSAERPGLQLISLDLEIFPSAATEPRNDLSCSGAGAAAGLRSGRHGDASHRRTDGS